MGLGEAWEALAEWYNQEAMDCISDDLGLVLALSMAKALSVLGLDVIIYKMTSFG